MGREKQAPCREPDVGFDPRSPGSHPGLKAGVKPLSHPGIPRTIFIIILDVICFLHCVDICTDGTKAMVGQDAGVLTGIKALAPNCTNNGHCFLGHHTQLQILVSLKNVLDKAT